MDSLPSSSVAVELKLLLPLVSEDEELAVHRQTSTFEPGAREMEMFRSVDVLLHSSFRIRDESTGRGDGEVGVEVVEDEDEDDMTLS